MAVVKQALVAAAARLSSTDSFAAPTQFHRIDTTPVIHHLVRGLRTAGIKRVVIALDSKSSTTALQREISSDAYLKDVKVEYIECKASLTRGQATSAMAAATYFDSNDPLLLVANHLFDARLLSRLARQTLDADTDVVTLIDDSHEIVRWASMDHCDEFCKNGHCNVLVKVLKGSGGLAARVGKKLAVWDALEAGAHVVNSSFFEVLSTKLRSSPIATIADVLQDVALQGRVRYVSTEGQPWFGDLVIATLGTVRMDTSSIREEWIERAQQMLSQVHKPVCALSPTQLPMSSPGSWPSLISLDGGTIGEGAVGTVVAGTATVHAETQNIAVKKIRKGQAEGGVLLELGDMEQVIMWEVHVLQELGAHEHIVRVLDVVDLVDATYIVMQRVDGPELLDHMATQPAGRLPPPLARRFTAQMLRALVHAHSRGYLHCDIKPQNIRLSSACDHAVLTDWGYAQRLGSRATLCQGTPAYAPPEQLTGYCADSVTGRRPLCPAVDVWALGVTCFQMLSGELPFNARSFDDLVLAVLRLDYRFPDGVPREAQAMVDSMLQVSPLDRATSTELLNSEWVSPLVMQLLGADAICGACDEEPIGRGWRQMREHRLLLGLFYASICLGLLLLCTGSESEAFTVIPELP